MKFLVVEDHPLIRMGLKLLIFELEPNATVTQCDAFPDGLAFLEKQSFDLLILDIDVPGGENIKMINMVKGRQPDITILLHSGYDEQAYALQYIKAGAHGYLSKQAPPEEFTIAFKAVMGGSKYVSTQVQQILLKTIAESDNDKTIDPLRNLSTNEIRVMQLLTEGGKGPKKSQQL